MADYNSSYTGSQIDEGIGKAYAANSYADEIVKVSSTQPTASQNKLWVDTDGGSGNNYEVPTVAEMQAADSSILGNLAMIESSPATQAHAVGDYIVWNGQLYKVIAAIAQGESLTVGTNVESTTVGDQHIIRSGTYTLDSGISLADWGAIQIYRYGKLVCVSAIGVRNSQANITTRGINVPWKASGNFYSNMGGSGSGVVVLHASSKKVVVQSATANTSLAFQLIYFTDDP